MSSASDSGMVKMMGVVLAAIVILGLAAGIVATALSKNDSAASDSFIRNALIERISPVAGVRTSADDLPDTTVAAASEGAAPEVDTAAAEEAAAAAVAVLGQAPELGLSDKIKQAVDGGCSGCHISGVAGAPKLGDAAAWQPRLDKGMEALTASVINGLNAMPAGGGSTLTELEVPVAIQYLLSK